MPGKTSKRKRNCNILSLTDPTSPPVPMQRSRYAHAADVALNNLLTVSEEVSKEWHENKKDYCKIMQKSTYTKKITACFEALGISSSKREHWGRNTAPAIMDLDEVCGLEQRNMGNWAADVFQKSYCKKLPLGALRVLAGFSKTKGYYKNPRTTFVGKPQHAELAKKIFPWLEIILNDAKIKDFPTAKGFLTLLSNLRWVLLQDAAILIKTHGRTHAMFQHNPEIFNCELFHDYATDLHNHIDEATDPNDINIETLLPGVLQKFDDIVEIQNEMKENISSLKTELTVDKIGQEFDCKMKSFSNVIANAVSCASSAASNVLTSYAGNAITQSQVTDLVITPNNDTCVQPQQQLITQSPDGENNVLVDGMDSQVRGNTGNTNDIAGEYEIPVNFDTVQDMVDHWQISVLPRLSIHKSNWRKHLSKKDNRKYSRLKKVIDSIDNMVSKGAGREDVMDKFENYYANNKKVFTKLTDDFLKVKK